MDEWFYGYMVLMAFVILGGGRWTAQQLGGWLEHRRLVQRHRLGIAPPAECGCGHSLSFHDPQTGHCHARAREAVKWKWDKREEEEYPTVWELVECTCRRYVGPEPLTEMFAPGLSDSAHEVPPLLRKDPKGPAQDGPDAT